MTFRHYEGDSSSAKWTGWLYPRRNPWYSLSEAESTSGHTVRSGVPWKKSPVTPPGIDTGTLVAQCLNHYATDTDGKTARLEKDLSRCHFVTRKFHVDCTGIKPRPPYRGVVEYPRELSCGHMTRLYYFSIEGYSLFFILNVQKLPT